MENKAEPVFAGYNKPDFLNGKPQSEIIGQNIPRTKLERTLPEIPIYWYDKKESKSAETRLDNDDGDLMDALIEKDSLVILVEQSLHIQQFLDYAIERGFKNRVYSATNSYRRHIFLWRQGHREDYLILKHTPGIVKSVLKPRFVEKSTRTIVSVRLSDELLLRIKAALNKMREYYPTLTFEDLVCYTLSLEYPCD